MRPAGGVAAAAVAALSVVTSPASAADDGRRDEARLLMFSTADLWRHGGFMHGGAVWSPGGVDREGFALKLMLGGGTYRYRSGALGNAEVSGRLVTGAVMPGWRFVRGKLIAAVYGGLDLQHHDLRPDDFAADLRGGYAGLRATLELWYEPSPSTMVAADGSVSTIGTSYNARLALGFKLFERYYLGPEVQGFAAGDNYRQFRAGLHVTALRTGPFEWSAGLGWTRDSDDRSGLYGRLGVLTRR